jgi:hypothetical protein
LAVAFELNRITGTPLIPMLRPENASVRADDAMIELQLSTDHEFELHFPAPDGIIQTAWLEMAADVFVHLTEMDNEVQLDCAKQSAGSPYPSSYFEGELAYITLTDPAEAVLHYFVIGCNSEWDERFVRGDGTWSRVKQAEPTAAGDGLPPSGMAAPEQ